jgi:hypothetical protein
VPDTRLSFDELGMHSIRPLLRASDYRFRELCAIEKNLNSLRGHGGGLQILSELAYFSEQLAGFESLPTRSGRKKQLLPREVREQKGMGDA